MSVETIIVLNILKRSRKARKEGIGIFSNSAFEQHFDNNTGIFNKISTAVYHISRDGIVINANKHVSSLLCYPSIEMLQGINLLSLVVKSDDKKLLKNYLEKGKPNIQLETILECYNQQHLLIETTLQGIKGNSGKVLSYIGIIQKKG